MAFAIADFRARLQYSGARSNQFEVILPFPAVSGGISQTQQFSFMCKSASLPASDLGSIKVPYFGRTINVAGDRSFPEGWQVTVINDEDYALRDVFEQWSDALNGHLSNIRDPAARFTNDYQVDATILHYGKTGDVIKEYDMIGVWPSTISAMDVAWDTNDTIQDFQVTLQYQWWSARTTT